jgi:hypothetical protein
VDAYLSCAGCNARQFSGASNASDQVCGGCVGRVSGAVRRVRVGLVRGQNILSCVWRVKMAEETIQTSDDISPLTEEVAATLSSLTMGKRYEALNSLAEKGFVVKIVLRLDEADQFHEQISIYSQEEAAGMTF